LRLNLELPADEKLFAGYGSSAVLSPDGTQLAFILGSGNAHTLTLQSLDQWEGTLLVEGAGMSRPYQPFFSPDGHWIGYVTPGEMRKVPVTGGTSIKLCDVDRVRGASWGPDGTIVFAGSPSSPLLRVPDTGGEPMPLTELDKDKGDITHRWPQWLPGGRAVLFTSHSRASEFDEAKIEVYDLDSGERKIVLQGGTHGRYFQTEPGSGFVIYANAGSLFAIPFDHERLEVTGPAAPAIEGVTFGGTEGSAQFSTSDDGKLAYGSGKGAIFGHSVVWVDREGKIEPLWEEQQLYRNPSLSPDGNRLALDIVIEGQADIWLYDIDRGVPTRLTFSDLDDHSAVWSPDGEYVYYAAEVDSSTAIFRKLVDGSGDREELLRLEGRTIPSSITPDGRLLAFTTESGGQNWDIGMVRLDEANAEAQMLLTSTFVEYGPKFSPDGRWYAYFSDESGNVEIYVRSVDGRGKWQISNGGGYWPRWSPDGKELLFWLGDALFAAEVDLTGGSFRAGRAEQLFDGPFADLGNADISDVSSDGERVVTFQNLTPVSTDSHQHVKLVLNWDAELKRRR
jgi:serine/threonine-protein kinase